MSYMFVVYVFLKETPTKHKKLSRGGEIRGDCWHTKRSLTASAGRHKKSWLIELTDFASKKAVKETC